MLEFSEFSIIIIGLIMEINDTINYHCKCHLTPLFSY